MAQPRTPFWSLILVFHVMNVNIIKDEDNAAITDPAPLISLKCIEYSFSYIHHLVIKLLHLK